MTEDANVNRRNLQDLVVENQTLLQKYGRLIKIAQKRGVPIPRISKPINRDSILEGARRLKKRLEEAVATPQSEDPSYLASGHELEPFGDDEHDIGDEDRFGPEEGFEEIDPNAGDEPGAAHLKRRLQEEPDLVWELVRIGQESRDDAEIEQRLGEFFSQEIDPVGSNWGESDGIVDDGGDDIDEFEPDTGEDPKVGITKGSPLHDLALGMGRGRRMGRRRRPS